MADKEDMMPDKGMLTAKEVSERLGVGRSTVNLWCRSGVLKDAMQDETPFGTVWLIPESALENFEPPKTGRPKKAVTPVEEEKQVEEPPAPKPTKKPTGKKS